MKDDDVYLKTAAGVDELKTRARGLPMRLRSMLILVDGSRTVSALRAAAAAMAAPADCMESLALAGLIEAGRHAAPDRAEPLPEVPVALAPSTVPAPAAPSIPAFPTDPERLVVAQKFMIQTASEALGLRAYFFTHKLEKCSTLDDLRALLPEFSHNLTKAKGELKARSLTQRAQALIG